MEDRWFGKVFQIFEATDENDLEAAMAVLRLGTHIERHEEERVRLARMDQAGKKRSQSSHSIFTFNLHIQSSHSIFTFNLHIQLSHSIITFNLRIQLSHSIFTFNLHIQYSHSIFTFNLHIQSSHSIFTFRFNQIWFWFLLDDWLLQRFWVLRLRDSKCLPSVGCSEEVLGIGRILPQIRVDNGWSYQMDLMLPSKTNPGSVGTIIWVSRNNGLLNGPHDLYSELRGGGGNKHVSSLFKRDLMAQTAEVSASGWGSGGPRFQSHPRLTFQSCSRYQLNQLGSKAASESTFKKSNTCGVSNNRLYFIDEKLSALHLRVRI